MNINLFKIRNRITVAKFFFKSKNTLHSKVDELISILTKKDDVNIEQFYSVLEKENSDLAEHFLQQKGETIYVISYNLNVLHSVLSDSIL